MRWGVAWTLNMCVHSGFIMCSFESSKFLIVLFKFQNNFLTLLLYKNKEEKEVNSLHNPDGGNYINMDIILRKH